MSIRLEELKKASTSQLFSSNQPVRLVGALLGTLNFPRSFDSQSLGIPTLKIVADQSTIRDITSTIIYPTRNNSPSLKKEHQNVSDFETDSWSDQFQEGKSQ